MNAGCLSSNDPEWYRIKEVADEIFVIEEPGYVQSYLVNGAEKSILIDTGTGLQDIRRAVKPLAQERIEVVNTHWHFDHIGGNALFEQVGIAACEAALIERDISSTVLSQILGPGFETQEFTLPKGLSLEDYCIQGSQATFTLADGDRLDLGNRVLEVLATPGHTRGSMSFLDRRSRILFTGDFAYQDTFFMHFEESDVAQLVQSLEKAIARSDTFDCLLPAHGAYPLSGTFLKKVLAAFQGIAGGAAPGAVDSSWGIDCHRYYFDEFEVLVKPPGTVGVRLFEGEE